MPRRVAQIESEKKRVDELETQIRAYDARAAERRRTMGGMRTVHAAILERAALDARLTPNASYRRQRRKRGHAAGDQADKADGEPA